MSWAEDVRRKLAERGYSRLDIQEVQKRVNSERRDWVRHFDDYIDQLNYQIESMPVNQIVERAAKLADARQRMIDEKFPEGVEVEALDVERDPSED